MSRHILLTAVSAATLAGAAVAQDGSINIESTDLGDGLHMLVTGDAGNVAVLVGADGAVMVDDQMADRADPIEAAIDAIADDETGDVRFVINTHYHFDHAGGNEAWDAKGATIVAHDNVYTRLSSPGVDVITGEPAPAQPEGAWPVITFSEAATFHMNGQTIHVVHVDPAHTDGDSLIYFQEADVLHTGDAYIVGGWPFVDLRSGGDFEGVIAAREAALEHIGDDTRIVPGHGPMSDKAELAASIDLLKDVHARISALIEEDMSRDDIIALNPLEEWDAELGGGFVGTEAFTGAVYDSLTGDME